MYVCVFLLSGRLVVWSFGLVNEKGVCEFFSASSYAREKAVHVAYFERKLYEISRLKCTSIGLWSMSCSIAFSRDEKAAWI